MACPGVVLSERRSPRELEVAGQTVVVTLGITIDGTKAPLGIWLGSTENSRVCTAMLQDLLERGLRVDESILCVVDGGKGIRKALVDVLGDLAVIQRCQIHKLRNLRSYLPKFSSRLRAPDDEGSLQVQECRQGAQGICPDSRGNKNSVTSG